MIYHDISLDLSYPRGVNTIYVKDGSTGHLLRAKIFNNGSAYDLSTYNISDIKIYSGQNVNGVSAIQKSVNELIFNIDPVSELYTTGWVMCAIEMVKTEMINGVSTLTSTRTQNFQIFSEDTSAPTSESTSTLGGFSPSDRIKIDKIQGDLGNALGGFSLGSGAHTSVNAIQLGAGTNVTARTLQVYDKTLLDANGFVPNDRLSLDTSLSTTSVKPVQNKVIKAAVDLKANQKYDTNGGGAIGDTAIATLGGGAVGKTASSSGGGAAIGNTASASTGGAAGKTAETTTGGAVGNSAKSTTGGAVGDDAEATSGGAIGYSSYATSGGAVGNNADEQAGGGAVGNTSSTQSGGAVGNTASSQSGGAVGNNASVTTGGAIGDGATTSIGFAGGYNAKTKNGTTKIDAIQLGTGTNAAVKTLQVYDKTLLGADGIIPDARLSDGANAAIEKAHEHTDLSKLESITASANELNILTGATLSTTELNYVDGVTSGIQGQLDGKALSDHNHALLYSPINHNHDNDYSDINHNHASDYATIGHGHSAATTEADGFLSASDKTKLDKFTEADGELLYDGEAIGDGGIDYTLIAFIARYFKSSTAAIYVSTPTAVSDSEMGASDGILSTILSSGSDRCILIPKSSGNVLYTDNFGGTGHTEAVADGEIALFVSDESAIVTVTHYTVSQILEAGLVYITE